MEKKNITPQMERVLREVMLDEFDKDVIEKQLNDKVEKAEITVTYNSTPVVLTPGNSGPCC